MTLRPYLRRVIQLLNEHHNHYLDKQGGWREALLLNRALTALERVVYLMDAE